MKSRALELMQLHDGELSEREEAELCEGLSAEEQAMLGALEQVGDVVRALDQDVEARAGDIAQGVMARIEAEPRALREPAQVVRLDARPAPGRSRGKVLVVGLVLAAAAAGIVWLKAAPAPVGPTPVAVTQVTAPIEPPAPPAPPPDPEVAEEEPSPAASIEAVDFGNSAGSIFMVPAGDESTPVVWLVDEPVGARMEQL